MNVWFQLRILVFLWLHHTGSMSSLKMLAEVQIKRSLAHHFWIIGRHFIEQRYSELIIGTIQVKLNSSSTSSDSTRSHSMKDSCYRPAQWKTTDSSVSPQTTVYHNCASRQYTFLMLPLIFFFASCKYVFCLCSQFLYTQCGSASTKYWSFKILYWWYMKW